MAGEVGGGGGDGTVGMEGGGEVVGIGEEGGIMARELMLRYYRMLWICTSI